MEFSAIDQEATTTTAPVVVMSISDVIRNANAVLMVGPKSEKEPHAYYAFIECKQSRLTWKIMPQCKSICFNFVDILEDVPRYLAILLKSSRQRTEPADRPYGYNHFQQFLTRVQDFFKHFTDLESNNNFTTLGPINAEHYLIKLPFNVQNLSYIGRCKTHNQLDILQSVEELELGLSEISFVCIEQQSNGNFYRQAGKLLRQCEWYKAYCGIALNFILPSLTFSKPSNFQLTNRLALTERSLNLMSERSLLVQFRQLATQSLDSLLRPLK